MCLESLPHSNTTKNSNNIARNSAIADETRDAFGGHSRSPNMAPFHMLGMVSY